MTTQADNTKESTLFLLYLEYAARREAFKQLRSHVDWQLRPRGLRTSTRRAAAYKLLDGILVFANNIDRDLNKILYRLERAGGRNP